MKTVLRQFVEESLFEASCKMLRHLKIKFTPQSKTPIPFISLWEETIGFEMPKALKTVLNKVEETYLVGAVNEETLEGRDTNLDISEPIGGKYGTLIVFAIDIKGGDTLTRSEIASLTRGFNRMAPDSPVVVFIRNGQKLHLATCERSEYAKSGMTGERLGKVTILRDINCKKPHRGHLDILATLGDKAYPTFDELYKHWLKVFSSQTLTEKFYAELSNWFAWVITSGKVKFPNNVFSTEDDTVFNQESTIRLITRLIFVWFLKQKNLIPSELFKKEYIGEHFIENFDPYNNNCVLYRPDESKYYRLILQNLFFAVLNRPIIDEVTGKDGNRKFVSKAYHGKRKDREINNLFRYKSEFKDGGAEKFVELANSIVPFLNGGLFECLDHKLEEDPECGMYYDGFSEWSKSLSQLSFPDYFFFTSEEGIKVDLSRWYEDDKVHIVKVHGIINILKSYYFNSSLKI